MKHSQYNINKKKKESVGVVCSVHLTQYFIFVIFYFIVYKITYNIVFSLKSFLK